MTQDHSPFFERGWSRFICEKFDVGAESLTIRPEDTELPVLRTTLYLDRRGRVRQPLLNPYIPISFETTATASAHRQFTQWAGTAGSLAAAMRRRGVVGFVPLPPNISDVRPWTWIGFEAVARYTYMLDFPSTMDRVDGTLRTYLRKASKGGYRCEATEDFDGVVACLAGTGMHQGIDFQLTARDLGRVRDLVGAARLGVYLSRAPGGEPASALVVLHAPSHHAVAIAAGSVAAHRNAGATALLHAFVFDDLARRGAAGYDFGGANQPDVAFAKSAWNARLVPFYMVSGLGLRSLARRFKAWHRPLVSDSTLGGYLGAARMRIDATDLSEAPVA